MHKEYVEFLFLGGIKTYTPQPSQVNINVRPQAMTSPLVPGAGVSRPCKTVGCEMFGSPERNGYCEPMLQIAPC